MGWRRNRWGCQKLWVFNPFSRDVQGLEFPSEHVPSDGPHVLPVAQGVVDQVHHMTARLSLSLDDEFPGGVPAQGRTLFDAL